MWPVIDSLKIGSVDSEMEAKFDGLLRKELKAAHVTTRAPNTRWHAHIIPSKLTERLQV